MISLKSRHSKTIVFCLLSLSMSYNLYATHVFVLFMSNKCGVIDVVVFFVVVILHMCYIMFLNCGMNMIYLVNVEVSLLCMSMIVLALRVLRCDYYCLIACVKKTHDSDTFIVFHLKTNTCADTLVVVCGRATFAPYSTWRIRCGTIMRLCNQRREPF